MESILAPQILAKYRALTPHSRHPIKIRNDTLREQDSQDQLTRVFFAFSVLLASRSNSTASPYSKFDAI
jgi:hypothetical protein